MQATKIYLTFVAMFMMVTICNAQKFAKTTLSDFEKLSGTWHGTLTYLDYTTGKLFSMPADVNIFRINNTSKFTFANHYPNELNANSIDTLNISADGLYIDQGLIKSRKKLHNRSIQLITEELGKDGNENKEAFIRNIYTFNKTTFSKRKDIQFVGEKKWIKRHEYMYINRSNHDINH